MKRKLLVWKDQYDGYTVHVGYELGKSICRGASFHTDSFWDFFGETAGKEIDSLRPGEKVEVTVILRVLE